MTSPAADSAPASPEVDAFLAGIAHPKAAEIELLRQLIRAVDARCSESVKWNAPNYALGVDFATLNLRPGAPVRVVLHTGAKARPGHPRPVIDDPESLLRWLGDDRAIVVFADAADIEAKRAAFTALLRAWIAQLPPVPAAPTPAQPA